MDINKLASEIEELRQTHREDEWWDFKQEHYHDKADLVHDILCMANNRAKRDSYIIFGVENDNFDIVGVENDANRRNQQCIVNILRKISFAGGVRPRIEVHTILIKNHEIDVLVVKDTPNTPYYLEEDYKDSSLKSPDRKEHKKTVHKFHIYTRVVDNNTPIDSNADINDIEYLWKKRFGYDLSPSKRLEVLLADYNNWSRSDLDVCKHSFHVENPEYQIIIGDINDNYCASISYLYDSENMSVAEVSLNYLTTTLYSTQLWYMDEQRCIIPKLNERCLNDGQGYYFYLTKDSIEGKLLGLLTKGEYRFYNRSKQDVPILLFEDEEDKVDFEEYFLAYDDDEKKKIQNIIANDTTIQQAINKESKDCMKGHGVEDIVFAYEIYKCWKKNN